MPPKPESKSPGPGEEDAASVKAAAAPKMAGLKAWLPLLANLILMPVLAYATVTFVLKSQSSGGAPAAAKAKGRESAKPEGSAAKASGHEAKKEGKESSGKEPSKTKIKVPLKSKVIVNLAGTQATRLLMAQIILVLADPDMKTVVEEKDDELHDAAANVLRSKSISDLEKPGSQIMIRAELVSVFCNLLGDGAVTGILLTDFAVQ